jgi:MFS family permease
VGAALPALVLMPLALRIGRIRTHAGALACMAAGYLGLWLFTSSPLQLYLLMGVVGIGWAAIVSLPFAIVSQKVSQARMGLYMGLFNLSVVLPQLVVSLGIALMISRAEDKSLIFAMSSACIAISAIAWSFVREDD